MSSGEPLEMTDVTSHTESGSDSDMDEETGLTKRERRQKKRRQDVLNVRIGEHLAVTRREAKLADRDVIKKLLINCVLILLWYFFSLAISIVRTAPPHPVKYYWQAADDGGQYNKWMFDGEHLDFHFPLFTTSLHMLVQFGLSTLVLFFVPSLRPSLSSQPYERLPAHPLPSDDLDPGKPQRVVTPLFWLTRLLPCGAATSLDIGLGNTSLRFITLTFLTMCKSSSLAFVLLFAFLFRLESPSYKLIMIIATMTVGVVMMVAGEADFKPVGFVLVIASSFFSGFRWGLTQILLLRHPATSNPFATLFFLAPIMFVSLLTIASFAEGPSALFAGLSDLAAKKGGLVSILLLIFPGCLAFCMTTSEYSLLQRTNVVTLSICGIFKEVVTITAAEMVYHDPLTPINVSGLLITIGSIASYNYLKITKMRAEARKEVALGVAGAEPLGGGGGGGGGRGRRSSLDVIDEADDDGAGLFGREQPRSHSADPMLLAGSERRGGTPSPPKRQQDLE
jgi:solute carrier family 35, member C2